MKAKAVKKNWFEDLAQDNADLALIKPIARKAPAPIPLVTAEIPPFKGISREPLKTRSEAADLMGCCLSFLDGQIRDRMIFPQYKGRFVMIPVEEIENYWERSRMVKYA